MDNFNVFLLFPVHDMENTIKNEADYKDYMNTIGHLIDRADCEKGATLYYQGSNKDACIEQLSDINEMGSFYLENPELVINMLLANAEDWEEDPKHDDCFYGVWETENYNHKTEFPNVIKEIGEFVLREEGKCLLLNIHSGFNATHTTIHIIKDSQIPVPHQKLPALIPVRYATNFKDLENWFEFNREQRVLNITDERHNEKSPKYIKGRSPRLYDFRKENKNNQEIVQNLLNMAITDQRVRERESKDLMNYDKNKERYIWFEFENSSNQYHAYHLAIPLTHERDIKAEKNIPQRVLDIIKLRDKVK